MEKGEKKNKFLVIGVIVIASLFILMFFSSSGAGITGNALWDANHCSSSNPCPAGEGDCDRDSDCLGGLVCSQNVGANYGQATYMDVCESSGLTNTNTNTNVNTQLTTTTRNSVSSSCHTRPLWHGSYCTNDCPCNAGEGDCDRDSHCVEGTTCAQNVGENYGQSRYLDVCEGTAVPTCTPQANLTCYNGNIYWVDSCGNRESIRERCTYGCDQDSVSCASSTGGNCERYGTGVRYNGIIQEDRCEGSTLIDYGCINFEFMSTDRINCPNGCSNGLCNSAPPSDCHTRPLWHGSYCTNDCPCNAGEGDCDRDSHCVEGTTCAQNVGENYGQSRYLDVCEGTPTSATKSTTATTSCATDASLCTTCLDCTGNGHYWEPNYNVCTNYYVSGSSSSSRNCVTTTDQSFYYCGDGIVGEIEACDDGNVASGDGCSYSCIVEPGYTCSGSPSVCIRSCTDSDGGRNPGVRGVLTDDNGRQHTDYCIIESWGERRANLIEYYCTESGTRASYGYTCPNGCDEGACISRICGDGICSSLETSSSCPQDCSPELDCRFFNTLGSCLDFDNCYWDQETDACYDYDINNLPLCTDSEEARNIYLPGQAVGFLEEGSHSRGSRIRTVANDYCNPDTDVLVDHYCSGSYIRRDYITCDSGCGFNGVCNPPAHICGDGFLDININEECDDGNNFNGDGCNVNCQIETDWICGGNPGSCYYAPCTIDSAEWSRTSAVSGENVYLNVQTSNCEGETVFFFIREDDFGLDDDVANNPNTVVVNSNGLARGSWAAVAPDLSGETNPEYYFDANTRTSRMRSSNRLEVTPRVSCGDGVCDSSETASNCPADCRCNLDSECSEGEICVNGRCTHEVVCGDGSCDSGEDCSNCPVDCDECGFLGRVINVFR